MRTACIRNRSPGIHVAGISRSGLRGKLEANLQGCGHEYVRGAADFLNEVKPTFSGPRQLTGAEGKNHRYPALPLTERTAARFLLSLGAPKTLNLSNA